MQYRYWSKAAQMSADLKATAHRVRMKRPELFVEHDVKPDTSMDKTGKVTVTPRRAAEANVLSGRARHALATRRE